jgi:catechol 2,3-dioxygenase-like lactoylglutathione lyase family enzyme
MNARLESVQPVLMTRDVTASLRFYEKLGFTVAGQDTAQDPKYARVRRDGVELHLQWHHATEWDFPNDRPSYRFVVSDVADIYDEFRARSALTDATAVAETSWGTREFHVRDGDGNLLQFYRWL